MALDHAANRAEHQRLLEELDGFRSAQELHELRERIKVLERIATDRAERTARAINELR